MTASPALHVRGVVLPGDDEVDVWVEHGVFRTTRVPGARTVVTSGWLLPGLVDAHCHVGLGPHGPVDLHVAEQQALADRDTGALLLRDCGVPTDTRSLQERADLPRIIRAGRHLARPKRYIPTVGLELADEELLPAAAAEQARGGDGWIKLVADWIDRGDGDLRPLWSDAVLVAAIEAAHANGARVTAHVFSADAIPPLVAAGIDCVEHGTGVTDDVLAEMAARGTALVPTLVNIENFPDIAAKATKYPAYAAHMRGLHAGARDRVAAAIDAGVPVYAGTDAGGLVEHGHVVDEIVALHGAGMSRADAIGAASWRAREWLGFAGIVDGAPADLVAYDADPRLDLDVLRRPARIVLRGVIVA